MKSFLLAVCRGALETFLSFGMLLLFFCVLQKLLLTDNLLLQILAVLFCVLFLAAVIVGVVALIVALVSRKKEP